MQEEIKSYDGKRTVGLVDGEGRITYVGRLWHSKGLGSDILMVGPNGTQVIRNPEVPFPISSAKYN